MSEPIVYDTEDPRAAFVPDARGVRIRKTMAGLGAAVASDTRFEFDEGEVKGFRGLHLYPFIGSSCSQRVRIALEEKGLPWTSHHLNLAANEHATPGYRTINPNGAVPALVHDGLVYIESNDVIAYLEETFPEPPLAPKDARERVVMETRIAEASAIRKVGASEITQVDEALGNRERVEFLRDYAEDGPAWQARVAAARREMEAALGRLEAALGETPWLSGARFGLADVSWVVNLHRLLQARFPLDAGPRLRGWYERLLARPSFQHAVIEWRPGS